MDNINITSPASSYKIVYHSCPSKGFPYQIEEYLNSTRAVCRLVLVFFLRDKIDLIINHCRTNQENKIYHLHTYICMYNLSLPSTFSYSKLLLTSFSVPPYCFKHWLGCGGHSTLFHLMPHFRVIYFVCKGQNGAYVVEMVYTYP